MGFGAFLKDHRSSGRGCGKPRLFAANGVSRRRWSLRPHLLAQEPVSFLPENRRSRKDNFMPRKVYLKPPPPTRTVLWAQIILGVLFLPLGVVFVTISEGEARPFVAIFSVIWVVACIAIIMTAVKTLKLVNQGKIEIAEIDATNGATESDFAVRLRDLEALRKDGLISDSEYQRKRAEIMQEKW